MNIRHHFISNMSFMRHVCLLVALIVIMRCSQSAAVTRRKSDIIGKRKRPQTHLRTFQDIIENLETFMPCPQVAMILDRTCNHLNVNERYTLRTGFLQRLVGYPRPFPRAVQEGINHIRNACFPNNYFRSLLFQLPDDIHHHIGTFLSAQDRNKMGILQRSASADTVPFRDAYSSLSITQLLQACTFRFDCTQHEFIQSLELKWYQAQNSPDTLQQAKTELANSLYTWPQLSGVLRQFANRCMNIPSELQSISTNLFRVEFEDFPNVEEDRKWEIFRYICLYPLEIDWSPLLVAESNKMITCMKSLGIQANLPPLGAAVTLGFDTLNKYINKFDVNEQGSNGVTALHQAADLGPIESIRLLLSQPGIVVNAESNANNIPLNMVNLDDHADYAEVLIRAGADVNHCDFFERNAIHDSIMSRNVGLLRFILDNAHVDFGVGRDGGMDIDDGIESYQDYARRVVSDEPDVLNAILKMLNDAEAEAQ